MCAGASPAELDAVPPEEVAFVIRRFLEQFKLDQQLSSKFQTEDIDGQLLSELSVENLTEMFPTLSLGQRLKIDKAVKLTVGELKKQLESDIQPFRNRTKLGTFRDFDTRPQNAVVYEKGCSLPDEQSRPNSLLQPIHRYSMTQSTEEIVVEAVQFAAACLNERANGTIHFGVVSKYEKSTDCLEGNIEGIPVNKLEFELAITDEIYRAFHDDQREIALMCIRDPVYIPVVCDDDASKQLYVVELDIVPNASLVGTEVFFLKPVKGRRSLLLRYIDGAAVEVASEEHDRYLESRRKLLTDFRRKQEAKLASHSARRPNLHRKLHDLLTGGHDYSSCDIFPLLFLSPCAENQTKEYLTENFTCIKSLEPLAVFDFDPAAKDANGQSRGLFPVLGSEFGQVYKVFTTDNFDVNSEENRSVGSGDAVSKLFEDVLESSLKTWIFCNGYEPMQKKELQAAAWRSHRGQGFKEAVRFYGKEIPQENSRILIFVLSNNYDVLLGALEEIFTKFPEKWILVAESEKVAQDLMSEVVRRSYVEKEVLERRCVVGMPWSHFNQSLLKICGHSTVSGCYLSTSSGGPVFVKERKKNEWSDLEVLSVNQCAEEELDQDELLKKSQQTEEEYFRGQEVKWWNFYFKSHVLEREQTRELRSHISDLLDGKVLDDERVGVVNVIYQAGAGATTIAHHVLWDMRERARCCIVKQITEKTCEQIARFRSYEEQDYATPPVVLIDNDITDFDKVCYLRSQLNQKARREARLNKTGGHQIFCILIICRRLSASSKRPGRYLDKDKKVIVKHELQPDELLWFTEKYAEMEKRYRNVQGKNPKLLISFNLLKENFNPEYIQRTVDEFIGEIHDYKEKRLLKYIALLNTYDFAVQNVPLSAFNPIMCPAKKRKQEINLGQRLLARGDTNWEAALSESLNVLLNRTSRRCLGKRVDAVRIINGNLSQEILNNLCKRESSELSDVILEFLHSAVFKKSNKSCVQDQLAKITKSVLKTRVASGKGREDFAPIILAIKKNETCEQAAEVLKAGFDVFEDPMIGQQVARILLRVQNWEEAERFAEDSLNMDPGNSFLCDTYGQVFKGRLLGMWDECAGNIHSVDDEKAKEMMEIAFKAIDIFQEEQKLSDSNMDSEYNNYGFTSELRVIATLIDVCFFLGPFNRDKALLRRFFINEDFVPNGLEEILGNDNIKKLKRLRQTYENPLRRVEEEGIQLKEDPSYQDSPSYNSYKENLHSASKIKIRLLTFFGEDTDSVPKNLNPEECCEYRRRRVRKIGGMSLFSTQEQREQPGALENFEKQYRLIMSNVSSQYCTADDLRTILDLTLAQISLDRLRSQSFSMPNILKWTWKLFKMSSVHPRPYLEAYLYMVMFHWPTEWRKSQNLALCSCSQIKEIIMKWKEAFFTNHPAQSRDRKKPDRRKATTLFFLGQGTGFDEIAFYSEIKHLERNGENIWTFQEVHHRLKLLKGTLCYEGKKVSLSIKSSEEESVTLQLSTSFPITDDLMWQTSVYFFLGFCWSGPRAFGVRPDPFDLCPPSAIPVRRDPATGPSRVKSHEHMMSEDDQFWTELEETQKKLEELEKKMRVSSQRVSLNRYP